MKWLDKFKNIFILDTDEYEEYDEQPKQQPTQAPAEEQTKKSFRFPVITENDMQHGQKKVHDKEQQETGTYEEDQELKLPRHLQKPYNEVYDVEVSGIRELLEKRVKGKTISKIVRSTGEEKVKTAEKPYERTYILHEEAAPAKKAPAIDPLENRKKFVPTKVPSPVHGYSTPKDIHTLLDQRLEPVEKSAENVETTSQTMATTSTATMEKVEVTPKQVVVEEVVKVEAKPVAEEVVKVEAKPVAEDVVEVEAKPVAEDVVKVEAEPVADESLKAPEVSSELAEEQTVVTEAPTQQAEAAAVEPNVKHVSIANSTIHIAQVNVEQMPVKEFATTDKVEGPEVTEPEVVEEVIQQQPIEQKPVPTGSRLPFNVLMLKSDKQKLEAKKIAEQFHYVSPNKKPIVPLESAKETAMGNDQSEEPVIAANVQPDVIIEQPLTLVQEQPTIVPAEPQEATIKEVMALAEERKETQIITTSQTEVEQLTERQMPPAEEISEPQVQVNSQPQAPVQQVKEAAPVLEAKKITPYVKPPLDFLMPPEEKLEDREWMDDQGERLVEALSYFQIQAHIESIVQGPAVTQFEITVGQGTKVSKVRNLSDDIKLALAARDIRIDAPIPGKRSIGIEIPNRISRAVRLSEVTNSEVFQKSESPLEAALGLDLTGKPVTLDLRKMPHGLIAGATGSGKSVCINSILVSLLYKAAPHELKLMLIDPKMVELAPFNNIPHLVSPVITDVKAATAALKWAVEEMERRYQLFMHANVRDITRYNKMADANGQHAQKLPYMLIVIDELADLMMMSPADVEEAICRIAQKARACGIHLIVATQRPSVDVITGTIKSNIPTRIAFAVSSQIDSRTIIDSQGAERLLGRGDMLYLGNGSSAPIRIQGTFVTDEEIEEVIAYVRQQGEPDYIFKQEELLKKAEVVEDQDELFEAVCRFVYEQGTASTSLIQRHFRIGYNRAARLVDLLEQHDFISEQKGSKARDVFITETDLVTNFG